MKRVTGIGGVFFTAKDPKALVPGIRLTWALTCKTGVVQPLIGPTPTAIRSRERAWSISAVSANNLAPSKTFMVNYRVEDLAALLQALRDEGCDVLENSDDSEYGKFRVGHGSGRQQD